MLEFTLPIPPSVNLYLSKSVVYYGNKPTVQVYKTAKARAYENYAIKTIQRAIQEQNWIMPDKLQYVNVELVYYMERKRKDIDNTFKILFDCCKLAGVVIDDDSTIPIVKDIFIDKNNPRVEVKITVSDKIGVFKDKETYNEFIQNNCVWCKRRERNCSILKKSLENRIIPEVNIDTLECVKRPIK